MGRVRLGHSDWATKNKEFKVMEKHKNDITGQVTEWGTLNVYGKYYRVTERVGEGIKRYTRELNQQYRMGLLNETEYYNLKESLVSDLESKRIGSTGNRANMDVGRTTVFFENLMEKAGINDKLFKKENLAKMSPEQIATVKKFKKNIKSLQKDIIQQQQFYDIVQDYFKNITGFYELQKQHGGRLTKDQIDDMVANLEWMNKRYDAMKQQKIDKYAKK